MRFKACRAIPTKCLCNLVLCLLTIINKANYGYAVTVTSEWDSGKQYFWGNFTQSINQSF